MSWNLYLEVNMYATHDPNLSLKLHNAETSDRGAQGLTIHPITKH